MRERGIADPPTTRARIDEMSRGLAFSSWYSPFQMLGTPAATVTRCDSITSARAAGCRCGPGITTSAPASVQA